MRPGFGLLFTSGADDVRRATFRLLEAMTSGGRGHNVSASHTIPPETPDANISAMYTRAALSRAEIFDRAAAVRRQPASG